MRAQRGTLIVIAVLLVFGAVGRFGEIPGESLIKLGVAAVALSLVWRTRHHA